MALKNDKKIKGFTLIELLVVIVLLGIVTSFAVLSMGTSGSERKMEEEAKRLHALIKLVHEEAIIQAKEIAMEINKKEYSFLEYKNKKWIPLTGKIFKTRSMNKELKLNVEADTKSKIFKDIEPRFIRLYFLSSGEQTPFQMIIKMKDINYPYYQLTGEFNGKIKLKRINEQGS